MGYLMNQVQEIEEAKTTMQKIQSRKKLFLRNFFHNQNETLQNINIGVQGWKGHDYLKEKEFRRSML